MHIQDSRSCWSSPTGGLFIFSFFSLILTMNVSDSQPEFEMQSFPLNFDQLYMSTHRIRLLIFRMVLIGMNKTE